MRIGAAFGGAQDHPIGFARRVRADVSVANVAQHRLRRPLERRAVAAAAGRPVLQAVALGQHAQAYTLLSFLAITIHRRLVWFSIGEQALQILPLFFAAHAVSLVVRLLSSGSFPGWSLLLAPVFEAALWPVVSWILLAPQRRAPDPDAQRPL